MVGVMLFLNNKARVILIGLILGLLMGGCAEETDIDTKIELLKKLAYEGDASAQYHLGLVYFNGNVVPKDYKKAYAWLNIAKTKPSVVEWTKNKLAYLTKKMTKDQIAEAQSVSTEIQKRIEANKKEVNNP